MVMANLSYDEAGRLLRRAGFGGRPDQMRAWLRRGGAVDYLINYASVDDVRWMG